MRRDAVRARSSLSFAERLHIRYQRIYLFFGHQSLKYRHDGFESTDDFRARRQNGFANVVFIGRHYPSIFQLHRLAKESFQIGPTALGVRAVTGGAA